MGVLDVAASIGLTAANEDSLLGAIDEDVVLDALNRLAEELPGHDELFAEAAARVQLGRSAGSVNYAADSIFARRGTGMQLRYRAEMAEMFADLAIDVALASRPPAPGAARGPQGGGTAQGDLASV